MPKSIIVISGIIVLSCLAVGVLSLNTDVPNAVNNGFIRKSKRNVHVLQNKRMNAQLYDFQFLNECCLLIRTSEPGKFILTNTTLENSSTTQLPSIPEIGNEFHTHFLDSFYFYCALNDKRLIKIDLNTNKSDTAYADNIFNREVLISDSKIVLRKLDSTLKNAELVVLNTNSGNVLHRYKFPIDYNDGGIQTDGSMAYDRKRHRLTFTYLYKNGFMAFDTTLRLLYEAPTIDTIKTFKALIKNTKGAYTHTAPPVYVNRTSFINNGILFINSGIKADNESNTTFDETAVLDLYDVSNGRYINSLYIPRLWSQKPKRFIIKNDTLYALYKIGIASYIIK